MNSGLQIASQAASIQGLKAERLPFGDKSKLSEHRLAAKLHLRTMRVVRSAGDHKLGQLHENLLKSHLTTIRRIQNKPVAPSVKVPPVVRPVKLATPSQVRGSSLRVNSGAKLNVKPQGAPHLGTSKGLGLSVPSDHIKAQGAQVKTSRKGVEGWAFASPSAYLYYTQIGHGSWPGGSGGKGGEHGHVDLWHHTYEGGIHTIHDESGDANHQEHVFEKVKKAKDFPTHYGRIDHKLKKISMVESDRPEVATDKEKHHVMRQLHEKFPNYEIHHFASFDIKPWIGVDFDGTLAYSKDHKDTGKPIDDRVKMVKKFLEDGKDVRVCTARVASVLPQDEVRKHRDEIEKFCVEHFGKKLVVTSEKDPAMERLYDDRAVGMCKDGQEAC